MRITKPKPGEPIRLTMTSTGDPRYRVTLDAGTRADGRRRQVSRNFGSLSDARAFVVETRAALAKGIYTAPDRVTFEDLCERWLTARADVREVTRAGYRHYLKPVRALIGTRRAQDLRRSDIEGVVSELAGCGGRRHKGEDGQTVTSPASHRTVVVTLGTIRQVLAYGVSEGVVASNVARDVKAPRKRHDDGADVVVWEPGELLTFRRAADADAWAVAWRLTLSGLRRSEVLGLAWDAVDLDAGTVTVKAGRVRVDGGTSDVVDDPKSRASWRTVPVEAMHPGIVALMRTLRARQAADRLAAGKAYRESGLVVVDALGQPIRPEAYSDRFGVLCRSVGVPVVRLHSVRHTLALILHRAGEAPADVAALLGHSLEVHLSTYVPRTERGVALAASRLGTVLAGAV